MSLDWIKKLGSVLIIVILGVMLSFTFTKSISLSQITDIIAGAGRVGGFNGSEIQPAHYSMSESRCKENLRGFGTEIPDFILENCVTNQLKQMYVLPSIGEKLGVQVSEESVHDELVKMSREMFDSQRGNSPDDRLTLREIYDRQLASYPMDLRLRMRNAQAAYQAISAVEDSLPAARAEAAAQTISMTVKVVRYTNAELQKKFEQIQVTEDEIKALHEKEQKIFEEAQRKPYDTQREFVKNRLLTEKKQTAVGGLKQQLSDLGKNFKIADIERITGKTAETKTVSLADLKSFTLPTGEVVHLDSGDFLLNLTAAGGKAGPLQDGEATIYAEAANIVIPPAENLDAKAKKILEEKKNQEGRAYLDLAMKMEAQRGNFRLRKNVKKIGPVGAPDLDQ